MKKVFTIKEGFSKQDKINFQWQKSQGNYLAAYGSEETVHIYDRHGELKSEVHLPGSCIGLDWDQDGDLLALLNDTTTTVFLWDSTTYKTNQMDTGLKDPVSLLLWSKTGNRLAIGTSKGNLMMYNHATSRKVPILGKHTKRITCGAWNSQNMLAMGSLDKTLSINNADGDSIRGTVSLRDVPSDIQFSEMKSDERSGIGENTISCIIAEKTLFLLNLNDPENPIELAFQQRYGNIATYTWYGDGYIMIGFSQGLLVVISTHIKEIGQELIQVHPFKDTLTGMSVSTSIGRCAAAGDNCVKVHDLADIRELTAIIDLEEERCVDRLEWTADGQLLAVSTVRGNIHVFLTRLPMLASVWLTRVAHLTSLLEVTLEEANNDQVAPQTLSIEVEPTFIGLGPDHLAVGMNNRAWFYRIDNPGFHLVHEQEYHSTVKRIRLNGDYAVVATEGKLTLHVIEVESSGVIPEHKELRMFPDPAHARDIITHYELTPDFLIFSTDKGALNYFFLEDWTFVNEYKHSAGITRLYSNVNATRVIFVDDKSEAFIYNPVNDQVIDIPEFPNTTRQILWDGDDSDALSFLVVSEEKLISYKIPIQAIQSNTQCSLLGVTKLPHGHMPLLLTSGELTLINQAGKLVTVVLGTHTFKRALEKLTTLGEAELTTAFDQALRADAFKEAWLLAERLQSNERWQELGNACLRSLQLDMAVRVFRHVGDAGMVFAILRIKDLEDLSLLSGYVAMFLGEFNQAQDLFLASTYPLAALEMRRDLLNWDGALQLAKALAPPQLPFISKEYAGQLEFTGDYVNAMLHYERGLAAPTESFEAVAGPGQDIQQMKRLHEETCTGGVARMAIRLGDNKRGVSLAMQSPSRALKKECAAILEQMKQWQEAAALYEIGGHFEKAIGVHIKWKNWAKVGELLANVNSPKLQLQYAKAREAEGKFKEAVGAYQAAKDWDSVIRLYLEHLNNPEEAVRVVRETRSVEGAKMVAQFFIRLNDYSSAIQFLVMSKCLDEAFQLSQKHGQMETYAEIIGPDATPADYQSIALHFENEKNSHLAGKFFLLAGQYEKAIRHLLRVPYTEDSPSLGLAIEAVGRANEEKLTHLLIDYLMGETDNIPKDAKYLFRLYMALKQHKEAAQTAIIIAREEQNAGNYRNAHDLLFSMMQELRKHKIKIPSEIANNLMLLHSYMIAKMHIKKNNHLMGARMLIRVAQNISKFPSHVVPILTSTVIECHRSGLRNSSFSYAAMLLRPEYRDKVDIKYKKKLETIVRRPDRTEEEEAKSQCPYCPNMLPETELVCSECKNSLPYCLVTGRHMVKSDFTACPRCDFPALFSEFIIMLEGEDNLCPMCSEKVRKDDIHKLTDCTKYLNVEVTD